MALKNSKDVDDLLAKVRAGDTVARDRLVTDIYPELKKMAQRVLSDTEWRPGHTLGPTALVSQLWIKMVASPIESGKRPQIERIPNAAKLAWTVRKNLEDILTDYARARRAQKRPTALTRVDLEQMMSLGGWIREMKVDALDVHEALDELEKKNKTQAEAMKNKFFLGYTIEEAAVMMGIPVITYRRLCEDGEKFLCRRLKTISNRKGRT